MKARYNSLEDFIVWVKKYGMKYVFWNVEESTKNFTAVQNDKKTPMARVTFCLRLGTTDDKIYLTYIELLAQKDIVGNNSEDYKKLAEEANIKKSAIIKDLQYKIQQPVTIINGVIEMG